MSLHANAAAVILAAVDPLFYVFLAGALPFLALAIYVVVRPSALDRKGGDAEGASGSDEA
jgi:hypothetical protein